MTLAEERGWRVGDKFKVIRAGNHGFSLGTEVTLIIDDGSDVIKFKGKGSAGSSSSYWLYLYMVSKIEESPNMVSSPPHYQILPGVEVYDIREALLSKTEGLSACQVDDWSRSWEYLTRMWGKNGLEDAKKALWYLNKLIERMEKDD